MHSSYRGQYWLGPKEKPTDIQVVDTGGVSIPLPIDMYISQSVARMEAFALGGGTSGAPICVKTRAR